MDATMNSGADLDPEDQALDASEDGDNEEHEDTSEEEFEKLLAAALEDFVAENDMPRPGIQTFEEAGVLTMNRGLVVRIGGKEYQVKIVRSR